MKCGFCGCKIGVALLVVGSGYQVSAVCECGAAWTYDIYSLSCMALVKEPRAVPAKSNTWLPKAREW